MFGPQYPQHAPSQHLLLIAATPGDMLAEALAVEFQRLGWAPIVTDQVESYASSAQACIVLMSPASLQSPAVASALNARPANLIPLVTTPMAPPYAPWAVAPFTFTGSVGQTSASINKRLIGLLGPAAPIQTSAPYTWPAYPGYADYDSMTQGEATPTRRGRLSLLFAAIGGITLLACVIASLFAIHTALSPAGKASVSASATVGPPLPTPTLSAGFSRFTDPSGNFQINHPASWKQSANNGAIGWVSPTGFGLIVIGQGTGSASSADITLVEATSFKQFSKGLGGDGSYNNFQGPTSISMAGETWTQESADMPVHGNIVHGVIVIVEHHLRLYFASYFALKGSFSALDAQTFQPMMHSFYFLT